MERLETRESRLLELLHDIRHDVVSDEARALTQRQADASALPFSPYNELGVALPARMDQPSSRHARVTGASGTKVVASLPNNGGGVDDGMNSSNSELPAALRGFASVALCRANHAVPASLPVFYFEVTVVNGGNDTPNTAPGEQPSARVAVGYYRDGLPLEGMPGHNSIAFGGHGALYQVCF